MGPGLPTRGLDSWWVKPIRNLLRASGLFDQDFYVAENPDVARAGVDPLDHYLRYGDREGRQPMPYFDPDFYRQSLTWPLSRRCNALAHYMLAGRFQHPELHPSFDPRHFFQESREAKLNRLEPLHYAKNRLRESSDHFSPFGFKPPDHAHAPAHHGPLEPAQDDWSSIQAPHPGIKKKVDIVVPVHSGKAETLRCIYQVLVCLQQTPFELTVINDGSADQHLLHTLRQLESSGLLTLIEHEVNLGFVQSANEGLSLHSDRDVVLLNSDTEPHGNWLDRLRQTAYSQPRVATVTPLSNNATICSYPRPNRDNPYPLEVKPHELDTLASKVNAGSSVEAPTGVGFCLYVRRDAMDEVGLLDSTAFGSGYGEENDFCQRARTLGWVNLIAPDIYVWHWGTRSFRGTRGPRLRHAMKILGGRYPGYHRQIRRFVEADLLRVHRAKLDEARLLRHRAPRGNVLVLSHQRGGGAARLIHEELDRMQRRRMGGFVLVPAGDDRHAHLIGLGLPRLPNLSPVDLGSPEALTALLVKLAITEVHIHQLVDFPRSVTGDTTDTARGITGAAKQLGLPVDVYVHDYQYICPRINLIGPTLTYCGEPDESGCRSCLRRRVHGIPNSGERDIRSWRVRNGILLAGARKVIVPDIDVKRRMLRYFPQAHYTVRPHEPSASFPPTTHPTVPPGEPYRIVVPGAIGVSKGYRVLLEAARAAHRNRTPLEFIVMGYSRNDRQLTRAGVRITGAYQDRDAAACVLDLNPHLVWIPSVWPETYCYTLSIALQAALPVAAFDLGAPAHRLRTHAGFHLLLPLALARKPAELNKALCEFITQHTAKRHDTRTQLAAA
jgi:GT2 family glycosyltransferase